MCESLTTLAIISPHEVIRGHTAAILCFQFTLSPMVKVKELAQSHPALIVSHFFKFLVLCENRDGNLRNMGEIKENESRISRNGQPRFSHQCPSSH